MSEVTDPNRWVEFNNSEVEFGLLKVYHQRYYSNIILPEEEFARKYLVRMKQGEGALELRKRDGTGGCVYVFSDDPVHDVKELKGRYFKGGEKKMTHSFDDPGSQDDHQPMSGFSWEKAE